MSSFTVTFLLYSSIYKVCPTTAGTNLYADQQRFYFTDEPRWNFSFRRNPLFRGGRESLRVVVTVAKDLPDISGSWTFDKIVRPLLRALATTIRKPVNDVQR